MKIEEIIKEIKKEMYKLNAEGEFIHSMSEIKTFEKCIEIIQKVNYNDLKDKNEVLTILNKHIKELDLPIHCKDCEFYMLENECRCFLLPKIHPTEDWFCGFAKRKEINNENNN